MPEEKMVHLALRISTELNARVEKCAHKLRLKKHALAQAAVEAAVEAIERNDYQLVVPIQFEVTHVAVEKTGSKTSSSSIYPSRPDEGVLVEDKPKKKKTG